MKVGMGMGMGSVVRVGKPTTGCLASQFCRDIGSYTKVIQRRYKGDTKAIQKRYKGDTKVILR